MFKRPQILTIEQRARRAANSRGEIIILYKDPEYNYPEFTTESHYDFLCDTNQCEYSWIESVIYPNN